jgi:hypothetical protein
LNQQFEAEPAIEGDLFSYYSPDARPSFLPHLAEIAESHARTTQA